jgi:hypothetical protein
VSDARHRRAPKSGGGEKRRRRAARGGFSVFALKSNNAADGRTPSGATARPRGMGVPGAVAVAATAAFYALLVRTRAPCGVDGTFCAAREGVACARLRAHLHGHLHGQAVATDLLADAICDHLETPHPSKPLVLAVHGPPGVGKSYFHQLLAQAVYGAAVNEDDETRDGSLLAGKTPNEKEDGEETDDVRNSAAARTNADFSFSSFFEYANVDRLVNDGLKGTLTVTKRHLSNSDDRVCPGPDCPAYKIVFGTDYVLSEAEKQSAALKNALLNHLKSFPASVLVVEEYDKMGCSARGMLRQLLEKGSGDDAEFKNAIFVLEANAGFLTIKKTLDEERKRGLRFIDAEASVDDTTASPLVSPSATTKTQRFLRDLVFSKWAEEKCEDIADTKKAIGAVDVFAPFFPLTKNAVVEIVRAHLDARVSDKTDVSLNGDAALRSFTYDDETVLRFLVNQIEFEGEYAIEGGKEAPATLSRFVTRALRKAALRESESIFGFSSLERNNALGGKHVRLFVAPRGNELVAEVRTESFEAEG